MPLSPPCSRRTQRGLTLPESMIVIAIIALIVGAIGPSFSGTVERRRIEGLVAQFETDVKYAQGEAQSRAGSVRLSFIPHSAGSCYVVHTGTAAECTCGADGRAECVGSARALRAVFVPATDGINVSSNSRSMLFNAARQTVTPAGSITFSDRNSRSVRQVVNVTGRVRTCSPLGSMAGYRRC